MLETYRDRVSMRPLVWNVGFVESIVWCARVHVIMDLSSRIWQSRTIKVPHHLPPSHAKAWHYGWTILVVLVISMILVRSSF